MTIHDGYGQTETNIVVANGAEDGFRPGSLGRALPGHHVGIIDAEGNELPVGIEGDLAVRGRPPTLFAGYWESPDETKSAFRGDWYLTGDVAKADEEGFFWFVGRAEDVISSSGRTFGPYDVERVLREHPAIAASADSATCSEAASSSGLRDSGAAAKDRPSSRPSFANSWGRRCPSSRFPGDRLRGRAADRPRASEPSRASRTPGRRPSALGTASVVGARNGASTRRDSAASTACRRRGRTRGRPGADSHFSFGAGATAGRAARRGGRAARRGGSDSLGRARAARHARPSPLSSPSQKSLRDDDADRAGCRGVSASRAGAGTRAGTDRRSRTRT